MPTEPYTFHDLVAAWRSARWYSSAHEDLAEFHAARYSAMAAAFGGDLDKAPSDEPPMPEWMESFLEARADMPAWRKERWARSVHPFVIRTEQKAARLFGPFSGFLEMDRVLQATMERYGPGIGKPLSAARSAWSRMITELLEALYPAAVGRSATDDQLRQHGFDPDTRQPDPDDYI